MRLISKFQFFIMFIIFAGYLAAKTEINFNDQGWNSNQALYSSFVISNFLFSSNKSFYTNYGYDFDVNGISIYFVFQDSAKDEITIEKTNHKLFTFNGMAAYQVSELSMDTLVVEGWNGTTKKYKSTFLNINSWQLLNLNYNSIDKLIIKLGTSGDRGISDFNFDNFSFDEVSSTTEVSDKVEPKDYILSQNFPNPFNPSTIINYQVSKPGKVTLKIYDMLGKEISTLVNEYKYTGNYSVKFSTVGGNTSAGNIGNLPSGIYIYKLVVNNFVSTKKMILIK